MFYHCTYAITDLDDVEYSTLADTTVETTNFGEITDLQAFADSFNAAVDAHATTSETAGRFNVVAHVKWHNGDATNEATLLALRLRIRDGEWDVMYCIGREPYAEFILNELND
jgi:hypothetical protein